MGRDTGRITPGECLDQEIAVLGLEPPRITTEGSLPTVRQPQHPAPLTQYDPKPGLLLV